MSVAAKDWSAERDTAWARAHHSPGTTIRTRNPRCRDRKHRQHIVLPVCTKTPGRSTLMFEK
jgi:hypothetical protein